MPDNFLRWNPTCHHNHDLLGLGATFKDMHKTQYLYMMYVWGHSYEFSRDNNWDKMEEFCKMIGGQEDIWYATNIEVYDYCKAFSELIFNTDMTMCKNPSAIDVWFTYGDKDVHVKTGEIVEI